MSKNKKRRIRVRFSPDQVRRWMEQKLRASTIQSKKNYNRKDKSWKKEI